MMVQRREREVAGERVDETHPSKVALREELLATLEAMGQREVRAAMGKIADRIRKMDGYTGGCHVLSSPVADLFQVRFNCLLDGKLLTVPTPGLTKGFLQFKPTSIPPAQRFRAARLLLPDGGRSLKTAYDRPMSPAIDLLVTDALGADMDGHVIGDGLGHLDLQVAILNELNWLSPEVTLVAAVSEKAIVPTIPEENTDVRVHWIVTPDRAVRSSFSGFPRASIHWDRIDTRRTRRNDALFHLRHSQEKRML